jgi:hypothetical protein
LTLKFRISNRRGMTGHFCELYFRDYAVDTRLLVWYCMRYGFYFFTAFGLGFVWSFKCLRTDFTISGWKRCFRASSSVM